jgi:NAD(P)-dependent dehydrogenase (short-subunit alcohol dehydrogenase family)
MDQSALGSKVAIITGAANGIGLATAFELSKTGVDVALLDFDGKTEERACEIARETGRRVLAVPLDCTNREHVVSAFRRVREHLGPIDILVNNVGQSARERMTDFTQADLDTLDMLLAVNLKSCIVCSHQVAPEMQARRSGKIINITSESAVNGSLRSWDYGAAKAGIIGFTRAIARELAPFGVTVNAIGPGATRTAAIDKMQKGFIDRIIADIPMGRMAEPEDIAHAVAFFASDRAGFITGQTLLVNGGHWML